MADKSLAAFRPFSATSLEEIEPSYSEISTVMLWSSATVATVMESTACIDALPSSTNIYATEMALGRYSGQEEEAHCSEIVEFCWMKNMTMIRAICPVTCGCYSPYPDFAGFFQSQSMGCPKMCIDWADRYLYSAEYFVCEDSLEDLMTSYEDLWTKYVDGMRDYTSSIGEFSIALQADLEEYYELFNISFNEVPTMIDFILGNGFWDSLKAATFHISESVSHPRNLTWCAFLASDEIGMLLRIDVCADGLYTSLRGICPLSCKCNVSMNDGCPASCHP